MWEETEQERFKLMESLHHLEIATTLELEQQRDQYMKELAENSDCLL